MATNTDTRFAGLDDIFLPGENEGTIDSLPKGWEFLAGDLESAITESKRISANTADKAYRKLTSHRNVTSYSLLSTLHECPRLFELEKLEANADVRVEIEGTPINLDFAYGHAVGAGIQTFAATGNLMAAQFAAFTAWRAPWDAVKLDSNGRKQPKSLAHALIAIEKFERFWKENLADWEVVRLPSGRPAVELAFSVDFENGFYHFGHIDTILQHRETGRLAVWEGKTTGFSTINEAMYANSNQALGYSVVVDAIAQDLGIDGTEYEVFYIVYSAVAGEFLFLPFGKTRTQRAEWLQDTLLDHQSILTYERIHFYPKRGESCINKYRRTCKWFGTCGMANDSIFPGVVAAELADVDTIEALDYKFTLSQLVASQKIKG